MSARPPGGAAAGPPARARAGRCSTACREGRPPPSAPRSAGCWAGCGRSAPSWRWCWSLGVVSVVFAIIGPRMLGHATNQLFEGVIGGQLPPGITQEQAVAGLREQGQDRLADMLSGMDVTPGVGVDFGAIGVTLGTLAAVYLLSAVFGWGQQYLTAGLVQRTIFRLREAVDAKLARLPLRYFDGHPRGDLLSRVTNDIDNISTTLMQSLTQLISAVLTIVGVLVMMLTISPLLSLIALGSVPLALVVTVLIARRSQRQFAAQWERTGDDGRLHRGGLHRPRRGQGVRPPPGVRRALRPGERRAVPGQLQGPVHLRDHPPGDDVHLQPELRGHRRGGRPASGRAAPCRWATSRPSSSTPASSPSRSPRPRRSPTCCSPRWPRPSGSSRSSTRPRRSPTRRSPPGIERGGRPHLAAGRLVPLPARHPADRGPEPGGAGRRDRGHRRSHRGGQDHPGQPAAALLRDRPGPHRHRRGGHPADDPQRPAPPVRHGAAGPLAVPRHHPGEHRLRAGGRHATSRSRRPPGPPGRTTSSTPCPRATTRWWTTTPPTSPRARSSC